MSEQASFIDKLRYDVKYLPVRRIMYLTYTPFYITISLLVALPIGMLIGFKNGFMAMLDEVRAGWINL